MPNVNAFYDILHYNTDTFDSEADKLFIAKMFFRLNPDKVDHKREVF